MVLVYINSTTGLSKAALETVTYGKKLSGDVTVITNGSASNEQLAQLGEYGASKVLVDRNLNDADDQQLIGTTKVMFIKIINPGWDLQLDLSPVWSLSTNMQISTSLPKGLGASDGIALVTGP